LSEQLIIINLAREVRPLMEPEDLSPWLHVPTIGPYPKPVFLNSHSSKPKSTCIPLKSSLHVFNQQFWVHFVMPHLSPFPHSFKVQILSSALCSVLTYPEFSLEWESNFQYIQESRKTANFMYFDFTL